MMPSSPTDVILENIQAAAQADYSKRLTSLVTAAEHARRLSSKLRRKNEAIEARPAFLAILAMPLNGTCAPQCCEASWVRAQQIQAKREMLVAWRKWDPDVAEVLSLAVWKDLVIPSSKRIALAAVELLERSPGASLAHIDILLEALEHPRWQVAECAARSLGKLGRSVKGKSLAGLTKALRHTQWQVRKAVVKALGRMIDGRHKELERIAERDGHVAVRYEACKVLGKERPVRTMVVDPRGNAPADRSK